MSLLVCLTSFALILTVLRAQSGVIEAAPTTSPSDGSHGSAMVDIEMINKDLVVGLQISWIYSRVSYYTTYPVYEWEQLMQSFVSCDEFFFQSVSLTLL